MTALFVTAAPAGDTDDPLTKTVDVWFWVYFTASMVKATYSYIWDIYMDWGLLRNFEEFELHYSDTIMGFSDSLLASRQLYTGASSHRLSAMLYEVGLPVRESHDAMDDADDCRRICRRMAAQCGYRFMDFIFDPNWYHDVNQQWDWTFPYGYVTV